MDDLNSCPRRDKKDLKHCCENSLFCMIMFTFLRYYNKM